MSRKITITGDLGSGKSAVTAIISQLTGLKRYSTGTAQRALAEQLGIDTLELNHRAETDKSIDDRIDDISRALDKSEEDLIVDSRMAWHFVPSSLKVKLTVDPQVAAERVLGDKTRRSEALSDKASAMESLRARRASEAHRFQKYYGVDLEAAGNYDLVVDTTCASAEMVAELILGQAQRFWAGEPIERHWRPEGLSLPA